MQMFTLATEETFSHQERLAILNSSLAMKIFFRIHHSFLINLNRIKEFQRNEGSYVLMENHIEVTRLTAKAKRFLTSSCKICTMNLRCRSRWNLKFKVIRSR